MQISWRMITNKGIEVHSTHQDYARIKKQIEEAKSRSMALEVDGDSSYDVEIIGYTESCIAPNYFILKIEVLNNFSFRNIKSQAELRLT